jgi:Amt family ammonium transporter
MLASAAGAAAACALVTVKFRKPDPSMVCNGLLAGLVAISGLLRLCQSRRRGHHRRRGRMLVVYAVLFFEGTMKVDDPMGALSVHGVGGVWGVLSLGLLADGSFGAGWNGAQDKAGVAGAFATLFGGPANDWGQLLAQIIGALSCLIFWDWRPGFGSKCPTASFPCAPGARMNSGDWTCRRWAPNAIPIST